MSLPRRVLAGLRGAGRVGGVRNDILLNKNASSTLRTKRTPRYHLNLPCSPALRDLGTLSSRLSSACAVTGTPVLVYLASGFSSTILPGDIQRGVTEGASSQRPLLLYQPCQSLTPPGVSFEDYTGLEGRRQAISIAFCFATPNNRLDQTTKHKAMEGVEQNPICHPQKAVWGEVTGL